MADKSHWFYDLDVLSVSDYTAASPRGCTNELSVAEMMKNLEPHRDLLRRIARVYGKPLVFGECGCGPRRFQAASPSGCDRSQPADPQEQANYYEAFIRTFKDEPWCRVFYWWRWNDHTLADLALGLCAFCVGTAGGVLMAKLMNVFSSKENKVNPLIGSAGVSAVPMAARVSNKVSLSENPGNFILMQAMGPNVSGVIGSAVVAGILYTLCR